MLRPGADPPLRGPRGGRPAPAPRRLRSALVALCTVAALVGAPAAASAAEGGDVLPYGGAPDLGSTEGQVLASPVIGLVATPSGGGYWTVSREGGIFTFGDARFLGSTGGRSLNRPIVGMAATPSGGGYWLVADDGGIFSFGDARFLGSTGGRRLNRPIVGMAATPSGGGYWLVASDGGIFTFGDATFLGSTGGQRLVDPVIGMAAAPGREPGYWLVSADGGLFTFGAATFAGSAAATCKIGPVVGMAPRGTGGYWLATSEVTPTPAGPGTHPLTVLALLSGDLATELRHRQACQGTTAPDRGRLAGPLRGGTTTTPYGPRTHPIFGIPQLHTGIDLAGGDGVVRAPADGTVVSVESLHGYGVTTVVDHGDGLSTLVSHQRSTSVVAGQRVVRGQAIGQVGATGFATGPHVHLEVRLHGVPTDPGRWL